MRNRISQTVTGVIYQGQRALPGVLANLAPLGYSAAQATTFETRIADAIVARDAHAVAKVVYGANRLAHDATFKTVRSAVMTARDTLKPFLGRGHSAAWSEAGFDTKLEVAENVAGLLRQLQGLKTYFTAHSAQENAAIDVTAARFDALHTELLGRVAALDQAKASLVAAALDRDAKAKLVREELRLLLAKLKVMFDPFAAIWETFGFNRPGFTSVPEIPMNLQVTLLTATSARVKWDAAARAERYRIYMKVQGVNADFVFVSTREELDFLFEGLPANKVIEVVVSAVNSGGESAMSEVLVMQTTA